MPSSKIKFICNYCGHSWVVDPVKYAWTISITKKCTQCGDKNLEKKEYYTEDYYYNPSKNDEGKE